MILSPVKAGDLMMRVRILWTRSNICASLDQTLSSTP